MDIMYLLVLHHMHTDECVLQARRSLFINRLSNLLSISKHMFLLLFKDISNCR